MTAIFSLTLRQLAGGRRLWLVLPLVAVPVLAAAVYRVADDPGPAAEFADDITGNLVVGLVLPLVGLLLATAALGSERSDRTLAYLVLRPIPRSHIALPKLLAAASVAGVPVAVGGALATLLILDGDVHGALATAAGLLAGALAYAALFTWAGLASRHALVFGLVYVFVWEASLAAYLDGIRYLSIRGYTLAIIDGLDDERLDTLDLRLGLVAGVVGIGLAVTGFAALTTRKLNRMDVP
jgi:ABC-2 type transport system permease protein